MNPVSVDWIRAGVVACAAALVLLSGFLVRPVPPEPPPGVWFPAEWQAGDAPFAAQDHRDDLPRFAPRYGAQRIAARGAASSDTGLGERARWSGDAIAVLVVSGPPPVMPPRRSAPGGDTALARVVEPALRPVPRPAALGGTAPPPVAALDPAAPGAVALATGLRPVARPVSLATRLALREDPLRADPSPALALPELPALAAGPMACGARLAAAIPRRPAGAHGGRAVMESLAVAGGGARDTAIQRQVMAGNVPRFLRDLVPVQLTGRTSDGEAVRITLCVTPDYLAVGSDSDFVRVPLGLPAAQRIAAGFDMMLPTTRMVDAIHAQAQVRLDPRPMEPGPQMSSTAYLVAHNATLEAQRRGAETGLLVAGHKKDLVLTNRMAQMPGRVAIYGWHRANGQPIQPLSTVHGAGYADYSHGVRLVSRRAWLNGRAVDLAALLSDRRYAGVLSSEGPIARDLVAALR